MLFFLTVTTSGLHFTKYSVLKTSTSVAARPNTHITANKTQKGVLRYVSPQKLFRNGVLPLLSPSLYLSSEEAFITI